MIARWIRDLPLRRKLVGVITATSAVALLAASAALITLDVQRFRADMQEDLEAVGRILGDNTTAALSARPSSLLSRPHAAVRRRSRPRRRSSRLRRPRLRRRPTTRPRSPR